MVPESLQNPPILPKISLANDESPPPAPPPVLDPVPLLVAAPNALPPLRKELKAESLRRESPNKDEVVVDVGGGASLAVEGGLLLCPDECPAAEVDCPNDDRGCPEE